MRNTNIMLAGVALFALSACLENDQQRALGGAVAGALVADALDQNLVAGAALGAGAGAFCDDLNIPGCRQRY